MEKQLQSRTEGSGMCKKQIYAQLKLGLPLMQPHGQTLPYKIAVKIPCELPSDKQIETSSFLSLSSPTSVEASSPGMGIDLLLESD